jgi:hypothetical protein
VNATEAGGAMPPWLRTLLRAGLPINATGALFFAPPFPYVRDLLGLPAGHALYLWMLSTWIFAFGVGYWIVGTTGRADRTFLGTCAAGKASFALFLIAFAASGELPAVAALLGLPDLAMAVLFAAWLLRSRA